MCLYDPDKDVGLQVVCAYMTQTKMQDCRFYVALHDPDKDGGFQVVCVNMTHTKMEDSRLYVPT